MEFDLKMTAGMGTADDYVIFAKAGADEVFCGFVPAEWNLKFGNMQPLNRREVLFYHVQIGSYQEMRILKRMQEKYKIPVAVTFNALYYTEPQIVCILSMMKKLVEIGFKDFIICDMGLLLAMKREKLDCNIHISGEIGEWNRYTLELLQQICSNEDEKNTGQSNIYLKRIIFHRKNTLADMQFIIKYGKGLNPDMEFEAFFLNEMCHFTGGFCNSIHCDEMVHMCQMPYELVSVREEVDVGVESVDCEVWDEIPGESGCGFCALWRLAEIGITHLKIVGRGKSISYMEKDVENVRKAIGILEESFSEAEYKQRMKQEIFTGKCSGNCYYREVAEKDL